MNNIKKQSSEIEIKARVKNIKSVLDFLYKNAKFKKKYFKKDIYYSVHNSIKNNDVNIDKCIRLRMEHGGYTFCTKTRDVVEGVEVNIEREIKVSKRRSNFISNFISDLLCYVEYVRKEKKGYAFVYKNALVEVSNIKTLGDFIEIEFMNLDKPVDIQIKELKDILYDIGIDEKDIETTPYIVMLAKLKNSATPF